MKQDGDKHLVKKLKEEASKNFSYPKMRKDHGKLSKESTRMMLSPYHCFTRIGPICFIQPFQHRFSENILYDITSLASPDNYKKPKF